MMKKKKTRDEDMFNDLLACMDRDNNSNRNNNFFEVFDKLFKKKVKEFVQLETVKLEHDEKNPHSHLLEFTKRRI